MSGFSENLQKFLQRRSVKYGLPFLIVILGGSFGLREFTQLRYKFSQTSQVKRSDLEKMGIEMKKREEVTLESEYEKIKDLDIDNWEQVRGPRPWEEPVTAKESKQT